MFALHCAVRRGPDRVVNIYTVLPFAALPVKCEMHVLADYAKKSKAELLEFLLVSGLWVSHCHGFTSPGFPQLFGAYDKWMLFERGIVWEAQGLALHASTYLRKCRELAVDTPFAVFAGSGGNGFLGRAGGESDTVCACIKRDCFPGVFGIVILSL